MATPQQNVIVERKHKHLLEIARALLFQSKLLISYWEECLLTATFLINMLPSKVLKGKSPYFVLYKHVPTYDSLRSFRCLCYASALCGGRSKFEPMAKACVFLGYPIFQKRYKVMDLETKKISFSRDVHFYEDLYPFASLNHSPELIFPILMTNDTSVTSTPIFDS